MMAWLLLWTMGLMASTALSLTVTIPEDSGLPIVEGEKRGPVEIVRKESHPVLIRQKRHWIWNSLYVQEENPIIDPLKIGQLKSNQTVDGRKFEIRGEGANSIFTVDGKGDLFVTTSLDREVKSVYHLTAMMFDKNNRLIEPAESFVVQVTDINDHQPSFLSTVNATVMERSERGSKVGIVEATDADDPTTPNGDLRYSLIQGGETFEIDSISGMITCKTNKLDRETKGLYVVTVQAKDMRGIVTGSSATTSVTITITDINDNIASFTQSMYSLQVPENHRLNEKFGILELEDRDLDQNKEPRFTILNDINKIFKVEVNHRKNGNLMLNKALDYETKSSHTFTINVDEDMTHLKSPPDNKGTAVTTAQVHITVLDVDEPPVFSKDIYNFKVEEESHNRNIGTVTANDPDAASNKIRYSILDKDCPIGIQEHTGYLYTRRTLDREEEAIHVFQVKAQEDVTGLESFAIVNITVTDINDNKPELNVEEIYVCENDSPNTVIGILGASDRDDQPASFSFRLASESSNFTIKDYKNNTAALIVNQGGFNLDDPNDYYVHVSISDGGQPGLTSVTKLTIKLCRCDVNRVSTQCKASARRMSVSVHALVAILLCILTILVIVILFVLRKRYQEESLASMKNSGEIHEQLVTYDEEGGGEMDTNGYDVSILSSACHDGSLLRHPDARHAHPSLYAMVQKPPPPTACKGDMAAMIEVKKDEADHDRDGFPYDTLHIYGYEGPESLAGSLSSVESSSTASNLDYDFLNDWGPRFKNLAELYGVDGPEYYHQY